jgi:hypothetical protein
LATDSFSNFQLKNIFIEWYCDILQLLKLGKMDNDSEQKLVEEWEKTGA